MLTRTPAIQAQHRNERRTDRYIRTALFVGIVLFLALPAGAEEPGASNAADATATLETAHKHLEWLVGSWVGTGLGGDVEESWLPAKGGQMMGLFRMVVDGEIRFSEHMAIGSFDHEGTQRIELRLKHFDNQLHGWETKEQVVSFPFKHSEPGHVTFGGLEFIQESATAMRIELKMRGKDGVRTEVFKFERTSH